MTLEVQTPRCESYIACNEEAEVECHICRDLLCRAHAEIVWVAGEYVCICGPTPNVCGYAIDTAREYPSGTKDAVKL